MGDGPISQKYSVTLWCQDLGILIQNNIGPDMIDGLMVVHTDRDRVRDRDLEVNGLYETV